MNEFNVHSSMDEYWNAKSHVSASINKKGLIMHLVPILESKSQNGTQIFKSLKMVSFFVETSHVCPFR